MAEATLNDAIKANNANSEEQQVQFKTTSAQQFGQMKLTNNFLKSLVDSSVASNEQMNKQFEKQQEALRRKQTEDALKDKPKPTETDGSGGAISKLLASIKGLIPKKSPGLLGLLFGGVAAAMAFFPDWVKENLINPIIDVINVFRGEDATTTLGKVVENVKGALNFISDNFGEEAAWVAGILTTVAALKPITTLKVLAGSLKGFGALGSFLGLPVIGAIGGLVVAAGAILLAKEGLDYLRNLNIEDEVKNIQEKKTALINALASGNIDDIKTAESELRQTLTRMRNSTLIDSDRIKKEVLAASDILATEALKRQEDALNRINEKEKLAARDAETMELVRKIKMGAVAAIVKAETEKEGKGLVEAKSQFEKIAGLDIPQKQKDDLIQTIQGGLEQDRSGTLKESQIIEIMKLFIDMNTARLRQLEDDERFDGSDTSSSDKDNRLLTPKESTERNLKLEDIAAQRDQNRAIQLARTARGGFGEMDANIIAPQQTTNNNDNKKTTNNYHFYNDNTKNGVGTGLYSGTRLPANF